MQLLPKFRVKSGEGIGNEIFIQFPDISANEKTFFDADEAAGQTTLSAAGTNFSVNDYVVLGNPSAEKTEIVLLSGAAATTLTSGATVFAHNRGDKIQFIPYNQIVVERSTDSGVNYTPLTAIAIRPDSSETYLARTSDASTDYYRVRFYNSTTTLYSAYSDAIIATSYADNSVYSIKKRALSSLGEKIEGKVTDEFLNESLWEARREVDKAQTKWKFRAAFNQDIGDIIPGRWSVAAPTDLRDPNSNVNILTIRVGREKTPLEYQDRNRFNQNYVNIAHSTLNGSITTASTSIILTSSGDFDESGSVDIAAESISATVDNALYTANTESTATLSGVTSIGDNHASGRDVWQNASFGLPTAYTIDNGTIYFDTPFADDEAGENIEMDYYKDLVVYNSDADTLDEESYDLYVYFLKWKIKDLKANGTLQKGQDSDYQEWKDGKKQLIENNLLGQTLEFYV